MQIRILFGDMPQMLRGIIEELVRSQPDMELVGSGDQAHDLVAAINRHRPNVVVLGEAEAGGSAACRRIVMQSPHLKVVTISDQGRQAALYEFRKVPILHASPDGLLNAIRSAVHPDLPAARAPMTA